MVEEREPTNRDLMNAVIALSNQRTEDRVLLTTLRDSFIHRRERAQRFEDATRVQLTTIREQQLDIRRRVRTMEPVVTRLANRDMVRDALTRAVLRWWKFSTAVAAAIAGLVAWLNDWLPKLGRFLKS